MVYETDGKEPVVTGLSLFSGGAIGEVVFKEIIPGYRTVGYVEIKTYCRDIIRARIRDGILDDAPIFDDILTFNSQFAKMYAGKVDFISGGFPCTPFSVAGLRLGAADERNMWPATRDAISIIRPRYILLENVPGLFVHGYIRRIFGDLAEMRYDCEWDVVGASDVGAPHRRKRVWILAHATQRRNHGRENGIMEQAKSGRQSVNPTISLGCENVPDPSDGERNSRSERIRWEAGADPCGCGEGTAMADSECPRQLQSERFKQEFGGRIVDGSQDMANPSGQRLEKRQEQEDGRGIVRQEGETVTESGWWAIEPKLCGIYNGMEL
jgi:DNA (cytosine-5)-methyltransferase 1